MTSNAPTAPHAVHFHRTHASPPPISSSPTHNSLNLSEALDLWSQAILLFHAYEWEQSITAHRRLLKHCGTVLIPHAYLWFNIGVIRAHLGEYYLASEALTKAVKTDSSFVIGWYVLGMSFFQLDDFRSAKRRFGTCLALITDGGMGETVDYKEKGLDFVLEKTRVEWNVRQTLFEKNHKQMRAPLLLDTHLSLNRLPAGKLFEPLPGDVQKLMAGTGSRLVVRHEKSITKSVMSDPSTNSEHSRKRTKKGLLVRAKPSFVILHTRSRSSAFNDKRRGTLPSDVRHAPSSTAAVISTPPAYVPVVGIGSLLRQTYTSSSAPPDFYKPLPPLPIITPEGLAIAERSLRPTTEKPRTGNHNQQPTGNLLQKTTGDGSESRPKKIGLFYKHISSSPLAQMVPTPPALQSSAASCHGKMPLPLPPPPANRWPERIDSMWQTMPNQQFRPVPLRNRLPVPSSTLMSSTTCSSARSPEHGSNSVSPFLPPGLSSSWRSFHKASFSDPPPVNRTSYPREPERRAPPVPTVQNFGYATDVSEARTFNPNAMVHQPWTFGPSPPTQYPRSRDSKLRASPAPPMRESESARNFIPVQTIDTNAIVLQPRVFDPNKFDLQLGTFVPLIASGRIGTAELEDTLRMDTSTALAPTSQFNNSYGIDCRIPRMTLPLYLVPSYGIVDQATSNLQPILQARVYQRSGVEGGGTRSIIAEPTDAIHRTPQPEQLEQKDQTDEEISPEPTDLVFLRADRYSGGASRR
ncbi:MAG: hypothetical protein M1827_004866 [Pycnora praestabilis]|nr:MAG: hypothetical protein M1827_004866 [Pycnora praestabilis]